MTETNPAQSHDEQIRSISRMLSRIVEIAEQASLTGSLGKGASVSLQQYNASVQRLEQLGTIPVGFFFLLESDSSFDAVGVACAQLATYLGEDKEVEGVTGATRQQSKYFIEQHNHSQFTPDELADLRELLNRRMSP